MAAQPTVSCETPSVPADRAADSPAPRGRTLVLGLGNPLVADDGVGLRVVRLLRERLGDDADIEVDEGYCGGLRLMERIVNYERVILVDALCSGAPPGTVRVLAVDDVPTRHSASTHDVDLATALALGRQAGAHLPATDRIRIVAIEVSDVLTFSEECTPAVQAAIAHAAQAVLTLLATGRSMP
jgi:hydrogenase maturation protease